MQFTWGSSLACRPSLWKMDYPIYHTLLELYSIAASISSRLLNQLFKIHNVWYLNVHNVLQHSFKTAIYNFLS